VKTDYIKHIYWLTKADADKLKSDLKHQNGKLKIAKGIVCSPLRRTEGISLVPPSVWGETCARPGSWYRASDKNGDYLAVSASELPDYAHRKSATVTLSDFAPSRLPDENEKAAMIADPEFAARTPSRWKAAGAVEKRIYIRWARRLGSDVMDFEPLYLTHTANHANFLKPRFVINNNGLAIPYSIDRSAHLCSCCLELFHVIGAQHPKMLVAPCPGAVAYARLKPDTYLLVERSG